MSSAASSSSPSTSDYLRIYTDGCASFRSILRHVSYVKNRNKILARNRAWALEHPEKVRKYRGEWKKRNKGKVRGGWREWARKYPDRVREKGRSYLRRNRDKINSKRREYRQTHAHAQVAVRNGHLKHNFGITIDEYLKLLRAQNAECAICGNATNVVPGRPLAVDHDHATGEVRGLLCNNCNLGIGYFRDTPALLGKASDYLSNRKS